MYVYIHIHTHMHVYTLISVHIYIFTHMHTHMYLMDSVHSAGVECVSTNMSNIANTPKMYLHRTHVQIHLNPLHWAQSVGGFVCVSRVTYENESCHTYE